LAAIKGSLPPGEGRADLRLQHTDQEFHFHAAMETGSRKHRRRVGLRGFLWHLRSAFVAIVTLPIAIILSFLPMLKLG
jgi:hypothetical protein